MLVIVTSLVAAACHGHPASPDAVGLPDVPLSPLPDAPPADASECHGHLEQIHASCVGGHAVLDGWYMATTSGTCDTHFDYEATCSAGCAVQADEQGYGFPGQIGLWVLADHPELLCAETPGAQVGDRCYETPAPCTTRATLAADGTVAGQAYLTCADNLTCAAATAPPAWAPVACDATILAQYGTTGAHGVVADPAGSTGACLLAWDDVAHAITSAVTTVCVGDWECPSGALCDDAIPVLSPTTAPAVAVCKPGPRGQLTPAMLAR